MWLSSLKAEQRNFVKKLFPHLFSSLILSLTGHTQMHTFMQILWTTTLIILSIFFCHYIKQRWKALTCCVYPKLQLLYVWAWMKLHHLHLLPPPFSSAAEPSTATIPSFAKEDEPSLAPLSPQSIPSHITNSKRPKRSLSQALAILVPLLLLLLLPLSKMSRRERVVPNLNPSSPTTSRRTLHLCRKIMWLRGRAGLRRLLIWSLLPDHRDTFWETPHLSMDCPTIMTRFWHWFLLETRRVNFLQRIKMCLVLLLQKKTPLLFTPHNLRPTRFWSKNDMIFSTTLWPFQNMSLLLLF